MARARNIKPGFFRNGDLAEVSIPARMLFAGLWVIADREGRLEDRPKQIKIEIFPTDTLDCNALLDDLASIGVIERYEYAGKRYINVVNFLKHQNPHRDERESTIPDRDGNTVTIHKKQKVHQKNTVQTQCSHDADSVQIGLIPDSLIPEVKTNSSLRSESGACCAEEPAELALTEPTDEQPEAKAHHLVPNCPHESIVTAYHEELPDLPGVRVWTPKRQAALRKTWAWLLTAKNRNGVRYAETPEAGVGWLRRYFAYCAKSDFLMGRGPNPWNGCDLEWLVTHGNMVKVIEGKFDNRNDSQGAAR